MSQYGGGSKGPRRINQEGNLIMNTVYVVNMFDCDGEMHFIGLCDSEATALKAIEKQKEFMVSEGILLSVEEAEEYYTFEIEHGKVMTMKEVDETYSACDSL